MMDFKEPKPELEFDWQLVGMILLPLVAVIVVAGAVTSFLSDSMGFGVALLIGLVLGVIGTAISIGQQGNGSIEIIVGSGIVIVLTLLMLPVFTKARHNAQKRRAREALRLAPKPTKMPALTPTQTPLRPGAG